MSKYKCRGRTVAHVEGGPRCEYEADQPWSGRCPSCRIPWGWDKVGQEKKPGGLSLSAATLANFKPPKRMSSTIPAVDRVLQGNADTGFGFVPGATYFLSGPPGGGKSTLILQTAFGMADAGAKVLYASGEQSDHDVLGNAVRLGLTSERVFVRGMEGDIYRIASEAEQMHPSLLVVDSLQTAFCDDCRGDEGSVEQGRAVTNFITSWAKRQKWHVAVVIISQVNKQGELAGSRSAEHLVDGALEFDSAEEWKDGEILEDTRGLKRLMTGSKYRWGASFVEEYFRLGEKGVVSVESPKEAKKRQEEEKKRKVLLAEEVRNQKKAHAEEMRLKLVKGPKGEERE